MSRSENGVASRLTDQNLSAEKSTKVNTFFPSELVPCAVANVDRVRARSLPKNVHRVHVLDTWLIYLEVWTPFYCESSTRTGARTGHTNGRTRIASRTDKGNPDIGGGCGVRESARGKNRWFSAVLGIRESLLHALPA
jgi:hypothetical protein